MATVKIEFEKDTELYYVRAYNNQGFLIDSIAVGTKTQALIQKKITEKMLKTLVGFDY